mmetsp:Transcript_25596/g.41795  ORF Transcript_25596/g.41795 Transcript_25596/m.41795 type:complete len:232 (-) Transcript_25596:983-1678(-)
MTTIHFMFGTQQWFGFCVALSLKCRFAFDKSMMQSVTMLLLLLLLLQSFLLVGFAQFSRRRNNDTREHQRNANEYPHIRQRTTYKRLSNVHKRYLQVQTNGGTRRGIQLRATRQQCQRTESQQTQRNLFNPSLCTQTLPWNGKLTAIHFYVVQCKCYRAQRTQYKRRETGSHLFHLQPVTILLRVVDNHILCARTDGRNHSDQDAKVAMTTSVACGFAENKRGLSHKHRAC